MKNSLPNSVKRRDFLAQASLAFGSFLIVPRHVLGGKRPDGSLYLAPSDMMNLGFIGTGKQGKGLSNSFLSTGEVRITAISEVYQAKAKQFVDRVRPHEATREHRSHRGPACAERRHRSEATNEQHVEGDVADRDREAKRERRAGVASGAQRTAQHEEQHHAEAEDEHDAQERQGFLQHLWRGVHQSEQPRGGEIADRRQHTDGQHHGQQERLRRGTVHPGLVTSAGEARDEHPHAAEQRRQEHHDHEKDLQAHTNTRVAGKAHKVTDHGVVDHALQAANHTLQHGRPGHAPHGRTDRPINDGPIKLAFGRGGTSQRALAHCGAPA